MGNVPCCSSCSPSQQDYQDVINGLIAVEEMSHIDELFSYMDQLLNTIDQGAFNSIARPAKTNPVTSSITSGGSLLEKLLKRSDRHICKRDILPKLNREIRRLVIDVTNQAAQIQWVGIALSVVGFVLEQIEKVSSNREECIELLRYLYSLATYINQLEDHLPQKKLNRVLQFIVKGSLLCISQMQSQALAKFFAAPVAAEDLRRFQAELGHEYSDLSLDAMMAELNRIPVYDIGEASNTVTERLDMKSKSVKLVVIYGQGGIGKTTLATAVVSKLDLQNYKYCKVDIEESCLNADLKLLQEQILRDLYGHDIELRNLNEGRKELSKDFKELSSQPIFIFVDNAVNESDVEKLLPINDMVSLPAKSRILVTTRNLNETSIILQGVECYHYEVTSLPQEEAHKLLCKMSLGSAQASFDPSIDINGLLKICQGIPLVLKLVGARLREHAQNMPACRDIVENFKSELPQGAEDELSNLIVDFVYNHLKDSCKEAFLDIVFFFCNWKRNPVASIVGEIEFEELERAALVDVTHEGRVNVHNIVKMRGRMLSADGERITDRQSLNYVLQDEERIRKTKGIFLYESLELEAKHLNSMKRCLRVLILGRTRIVNGECKGAFENLRFLDLGINNYSLMDVGEHPRLSVFFLNSDAESKVCELLGIASSLRYMYIEGFTFDNDITSPYQIQSLCSLTLLDCRGFDTLPEIIGNLPVLEKLNLKYCDSLVNLPYSIGNLSSLKELDLRGCTRLERLPDTVGNLSSLTELHLDSCSSLVSLPGSVGNLSSLTELHLDSCSSLVSLPDSVGNLSSLTELHLDSCSSLVSLPDSVGNLSSLENLNLNRCSSLVSLLEDVSHLSCLVELDLGDCSNLVELPYGFENLSSLKKLNLNGCSSLVSLPDGIGLLSLTKLHLRGCSKLESLPATVGNLSSLNELDLRDCSNLVKFPYDFGNLSNLRKLNLNSCSNLASLPEGVSHLSVFFK